MKQQYQIERFKDGRWMTIPFAEGPMAYCHGYVDAMDSLYPSVPHRIIQQKLDGCIVIRETTGRAGVYVN